MRKPNTNYIINGVPYVWKSVFRGKLFVNSSLDKLVDSNLHLVNLDGTFEYIFHVNSKNYFIETKKGESRRTCVYDKRLKLLGCSDNYGMLYIFNFVKDHLLLVYDNPNDSDLITARLYENGKFEIVDTVKSSPSKLIVPEFEEI